jgi:phage terminase large subunit GpA-like protein
MIDWARALSSGRYRRCVMICATQMGKTDSALDVIGERLDNRPAPILYVGPSKEFCTDQFEPRLMALLDEATTLTDKVGRGKRNKKTRKLVAGVPIRLAHAGSATALKSDPVALALIDEYDGMHGDVMGEGGVLGLVEGRGFTYADFTVGIASTPSLGTVDVVLDEASGLEFWKLGLVEDVESPIWRLFQEGTRHHFAWPCPHCREYFIPRASCLKWETPESGKATPSSARRSAYVQKNRIFYIIRGWGARAESWLIDYGTLWGETVEESVWTDLSDLITTPVCGLPLRMVLIDSGFRPGKKIELPLNRIYNFCRRFPRLVRPTKGASQAMRVPIVKSKIEVTQKGAVAKWSLELTRLDTDHFKSWVHERVRWPDDQPGAWHLPSDVSDDYCKQIISEARMRLASGKVRWVERSKENHFLDCEAMQAAAAHLLNVARVGAGARRPTAQLVKAPVPDDDAETGGRPSAVRDDVDPNELHQAFAAATHPQSGVRPPGWIHNGGRLRGNWFNRG